MNAKSVSVCAILLHLSAPSLAQPAYDWKIVYERKGATGAIVSRLSVQKDPTIIDIKTKEAWTTLEQFENTVTPLSYTKYQFICIGNPKFRALEGLWVKIDSRPGSGVRYNEEWNLSPKGVELDLIYYVCKASN